MISAVQASMRDLVEMNVVTMFLEGSVERERDDWMDIALTYGRVHKDSSVLMLHARIITIEQIAILRGRQLWPRRCCFAISR